MVRFGINQVVVSVPGGNECSVSGLLETPEGSSLSETSKRISRLSRSTT